MAMSVNIGGNCNTRINQENIFETEIKSPGDDFKSCLKSIVDSKPSRATDLRGALATVSKTLQNDDLRGKGVIIFSDLHEYGEVKRLSYRFEWYVFMSLLNGQITRSKIQTLLK